MDISNIRKKLKILSEERVFLENRCLSCKHKMTRASLIELYKYCNKANCKCKRGELHGPFPYLTAVVKGKTIQRYVGKKEDQELVKRLLSSVKTP